MISVLTGANTYALKRELRRVIDEFVKAHGDFALERLDGSEVTVERLGEAVQSLPFLAAKKLVVLDSPSSNKQFLEQFETLLVGAPETTDILLVEPSLDKRTAYYKWLKKHTEFQEFTVLDERGLAAWAVSYAKERGGNLKSADATYLVGRVGLNQQGLAHELDKLLLAGNEIARSTIDELTERSPQSTVFELLDAAFAGNSQKALSLYAEQRAMKVEPQYIIAMLAWQLHILAVVKTAGERSTDMIASEAKISPYSVRKSVSIARSLSLAKLKQLVGDLTTLDAKSKRVALDLDSALQTYILSLSLR